MARAKFDRDQVIDNAMQLFWQRGFSGGSMQQIVQVTGLKPGSIYLAFDSKEGLYATCLQRYALHSKQLIDKQLQSAADLPLALCQLLIKLLEESCCNDYFSCFLVRTWLELEADSELHQLAGKLLSEIEQHYVAYLSQVFSPEQATAYANSLMMHIFGLRVYGFHQQRAAAMRQSLELGLSWLPWGKLPN
ncbi:TetR/AcrR family transcriptional regulator [Agarivorans sp. QJM3NY_25]|uniref:TetR/AcrR family transcriptional regulator n=1 Tax=Agarivorans sp. QJM3NY_25 TaxID=3421430 RepID=UPI003D7EC459